MAKTKIVQNSFVSGVMNDKAWGRTDVAKYYNSVAEANNMLIAVTGGAFKRPGSQYLDITDVPINTVQKEARLVDFVFNTDQKYIFLVYAETIDIYHVPSRGEGFDPTGAPFASLVGLTELTPTIIEEMSVVQRGDVTLFFHTDMQTRIITRTGVEAFSYGTLAMVPPLSDPADVGTEMWSDILGWPSYAVFYQGRLFCAGSTTYPLTVWGSKSQDYFDFQIAVAEGDSAGAPIKDTIDSDKINNITGLYAGRNLQLFTTGAEFINNAAIITPLDSSWQIQTRFGSEANGPIAAADGSTFYVDRHSAVREFIYNYEQDAYTSNDMTTLATQLFSNPFRLEHVKSAKSNLGRYIYVLNDLGDVAVLNFDRAENVNAWSKLEMGGIRTVIDISTVDNELYMLVRDGDNYYLERLDLSDTTTYCDNFSYFLGDVPVTYCDTTGNPLDTIECQTTVGGNFGVEWLLDGIWCKLCQMFTDPLTPPVSEITGLERFNDRNVSYILDGVNQGEYLVTNGIIPIVRPFTIAQVGYKYNSNISSLPLASPSFQAELNEKRIIKMRMYMYKTDGFYINDEFINSSFYDTAAYSVKPDAYTGMYEFYTLGWDTLETYKISSDDPSSFAILKNEITIDISKG